MEEIWKEIESKPTHEISNLGRIRNKKTGRVLKLRNNKGYQTIHWTTHGKNVYVHFLVATAFVSNPNNYTEINHKDENTANNIAVNLEWCNHKYNCDYGTRNERISKKKTRVK